MLITVVRSWNGGCPDEMETIVLFVQFESWLGCCTL